MKDTTGKVPMELLPPEAIEAWAMAMKEGADKYNPNDWREGNGMPWSWLIAAIMRHSTKMLKGENFDTGSPIPGMTHAAKIMASASMLVYYLEHHQTYNKDDRFVWKSTGSPEIMCHTKLRCNSCETDNITKFQDGNGWHIVCRLCGNRADHSGSETAAITIWRDEFMKE